MSTDPLSLWQVLKEEYESFHGPLHFYLKQPGKLAADLNNSPNALSSYLVSQLSERARRELAAYEEDKPFPENLQSELTDRLHALLADPTLYQHYPADVLPSFDSILKQAGVTTTTAQLSGQPLPGDAPLVEINRLLLDAAYTDVLSDLH
ncbi:MAG TPA: hypothetical protein VGC64_08920, partial [Pyrinomonadaceae bacterium]